LVLHISSFAYQHLCHKDEWPATAILVRSSIYIIGLISMTIIECPKCKRKEVSGSSLFRALMWKLRCQKCSSCGGIGYIRYDFVLRLRPRVDSVNISSNDDAITDRSFDLKQNRKDNAYTSRKELDGVLDDTKIKREYPVTEYGLSIDKGDILLDKGIYDQAIGCYEETIRLPISEVYLAVVWNRIGNALNHLGKYDEAIKAYDKAIELEPSEATVDWQNKGCALKALGYDSEAEIAFAQARELGKQR
jgi:tetratricopeptide (TPR) repeat protein